MLTYDFREQTVIVTGGTRGIGAAISTAFLNSGARVVATYTRNAAAAQAFAAHCAEASDRLELQRFNVADYDAVEAFFRDFDTRHTHLEVLVSNAGIRRDRVVGMMSRKEWEEVLHTNLSGAYHMAKFAVHRMLPARYGRIVCISSPAARIGFEGQANYAAAKAGLVAFTRSLAKEVARRKITANCVSPGFIDTDFLAELPDMQRKQYRGMVPIRRFGTPEEVAHCVLFLASAAAGYVNGATLEVSGGL